MAQPNHYNTIADYWSVRAIVDEDGVLWMWGPNGMGQLGNGGQGDSYEESLLSGERLPVQTTPTRILDQVCSVAVGEEHTAALRTDGTLWMWGLNAQGQIGNGGAANSYRDGNPVQNTPVQVMSDVAAVACGAKFTAAIKTDGSLWMWGSTMYGELGSVKGDISYPYYGAVGQSTPVKIMNDVAAVSCGDYHVAVIKTDGSLWTWGENSCGQLGNGSTQRSTTPVKVMDHIKVVSCGFCQTAAVTDYGELYAWGNLGIGFDDYGNNISYQCRPLQIMEPMNDESVIYACCTLNGINFIMSSYLSDNPTLYFWKGSARQVLDDVQQVCCDMAATTTGAVCVREDGDSDFQFLSTPSAGLTSKSINNYGGTLASGLNWEFRLGDGAMRVWGDGALLASWEDQIPFISLVRSLTIEEGVTGIGETAFSNQSGIHTLRIPVSMERIGRGAFGAKTITGKDNAPGVYYEGTPEAWKRIVIEPGNEALANASISFGGKDVAYARTQTVVVDGDPVEFEMYALKDASGYDTNYIKIRDLAYMLDGTEAQFNVGWDGAVSLTGGEAYDYNGSEMYTPFSGNRVYQDGVMATMVDGRYMVLESIVLTDNDGGGYTYYKLRDIGMALGFNVGWSADQGVYIETNRPYGG